PFIFLAVALILVFVGALLRSYWAAVMVAIGLSVVMMSYSGINSLVGLKVESPLIIFIVPIALISFGVDFFIHGAGRVREMQVEGHASNRAYPLGATLLFTALLLAAASSVGAFLSNASSGIQAVTEFGIAAAIAIALSYGVLGLIAPRQLLAVEEALGPRPADHGLHVLRRLGFLGACLLAGIVVTMTIVMPQIGAVLFLLVLIGLLFFLPFRVTKRRNAKAAAAGKQMTTEVKGAGHGFTAAGSIVHFLARWRVITVPVVVVLAIAGTWAATQVESAFEIKDFFSSRTDFVKSLDKVETHLGSSASGAAFIYVEGDLTSPSSLIALDRAAAEASATGADLVHDFNGDVEVSLNASSLVRFVMATPGAPEAVADATDVSITDADGDGLPDDPTQVAAIFGYITANGIPAGGVTVLRADQVQRYLYLEEGIQATRVEVLVPSITDDDNVLAVRADLDTVAAGLESTLGSSATVISVSGGAIASQAGLAAFTGSMLTSLPIAVAITVLLALLVMRSVRYALIVMVPILLVVAWLYGFMYLFDYKINVITATIAAIAIGVGIDYATHFTVRFRQEFEGEPSRFPALRRTGVGTGGALALSALTSITGFLVMATSPMPMFATFGLLTAVMIFLALVVSLLVLPSLLLLVTPSRKGEEREAMEAAITGGEFEYEPHARATADRHESESESEEGSEE
ncbi:MMPL family transporter, partial [bacterium]|nr:MMPL family transporter [bacterium]